MGKVRRRRESGLRFSSIADRGDVERGAARIRGPRSRNGGRPVRDHGRGGREGSAAVWAHVRCARSVTGWGWASGRFRLATRYCCNGPVPVQHPNNFILFFKTFKRFKVTQYETCTSTTPKISNHGMILDIFKRNNFTFGRNSNSQQHLN
jgi:hypothetical protein